MESKLVQDFPLRGRAVYLRIKKRRWRHKTTGKVIKRDFSFIADGSKFTQELSDFLKEAGGYAGRYHEKHSQLLRDQWPKAFPHYKHKISGYKQWGQLPHAQDYLVYPENMTDKLSIDEVCLSKGELYTFVTNKNVGSRNKRSVVAVIRGTEVRVIQGSIGKDRLGKTQYRHGGQYGHGPEYVVGRREKLSP